MGQARHPLSLVLALLALGAAALLIGGCSSSDENTTQGDAAAGESTTSSSAPAGATAQECAAARQDMAALRVTGIDCAAGREVAASWSAKGGCRDGGASRTSCAVEGYRCLGAASEHGLAVSCARPGRSASFIARRQ